MLMNRVERVKALPDYRLDVVFRNGEHGVFDCTIFHIHAVSVARSEEHPSVLPHKIGVHCFDGIECSRNDGCFYLLSLCVEGISLAF